MNRLYALHNYQNLMKHTHPPYDGPGFEPIVPGNVVLAHGPCQDVIRGIQKSSVCPDSHWGSVYLPVFRHFAEWVQAMPYTGKSDATYACPYGLCLQALDRAYAILQYFQKSTRAPAHTISHAFSFTPAELALWEFALVTAGMYAELGYVALIYQVGITDPNLPKQPVSWWDPHQGSMHAQFPHQLYRLEGLSDTLAHSPLIRKLTPVLARQLLPHALFSWLASHPSILEAWLLWLMREPSGLQGAAQSLWIENLALQQALLEYTEWMALLEQLKLFPEEKPEIPSEPPHRLSDLTALQQSNAASPDQALLRLYQDRETAHLGTGFLVWLQEGIRNGRFLQSNYQSMIHVTDENVALLFPGIFQEFCRQRTRHADWGSVFRQFVALGVAHVGNLASSPTAYLGPHAPVAWSDLHAGTGLPAHILEKHNALIVPTHVLDPGQHMLPVPKLSFEETATAYPRALIPITIDPPDRAPRGK